MRILRHKLLITVILILALAGAYVGVNGFGLPGMGEVERHQRVVLYHSDPLQILEGSRQIWQEWKEHRPPADQYGGRDPADPKLPPAIAALDAHAIDIYASGVRIELGGQGCHYGFEAYLSNDPDPVRTDWRSMYSFKELLPGLWYYAENGIVRSDSR